MSWFCKECLGNSWRTVCWSGGSRNCDLLWLLLLFIRLWTHADMNNMNNRYGSFRRTIPATPCDFGAILPAPRESADIALFRCRHAIPVTPGDSGNAAWFRRQCVIPAALRDSAGTVGFHQQQRRTITATRRNSGDNPRFQQCCAILVTPAIPATTRDSGDTKWFQRCQNTEKTNIYGVLEIILLFSSMCTVLVNSLYNCFHLHLIGRVISYSCPYSIYVSHSFFRQNWRRKKI